MRKLLLKIVSHATIPVIDVATGRKEDATYLKILGYVVNIKYKPTEECDHSHYLGLN